MRLDKHLVSLIQCSRGEAQKYIEGGWVLVDGETIDLPQFQIEDQQVVLHQEANLETLLPQTILLNVPASFSLKSEPSPLSLITPESRAPEDKSGIRVLKRHFSRLGATAPIQKGASGLMVFSQDGRIVHKLVDEAKTNEQEYSVKVSGTLDEAGLEKLNQKIERNGWVLPQAKVSWQTEDKLRFALKNIHEGQIEFMCQQVGLTIVSMKRLRIGRVALGKIAEGQWRYLPENTWF